MADEQIRVIFTPEQQAKVQELMDRAFAKGLKKGSRETEKKYESLFLPLRAEISALKKPKKWFSLFGGK